MYRVVMNFFENLVRLHVTDDEGQEVLSTTTLAESLIGVIAVGAGIAVKGTIPALPTSLDIQVAEASVIITDTSKPDCPVVVDRASFLSTVIKGYEHGQKKQVVERPDSYLRTEAGSNF